MLSDTVGFVRDLPHHLVASFRATLEEATHSDLLLIVLDVADPAADLHYRTVMSTLDELFDDIRRLEQREAKRARNAGQQAESWAEPKRVLLLNKIDRLADNRELLVWKQRVPESIAICSLPAEQGPEGQPADRPGQAELLQVVRDAMLGEKRTLRLTLPIRESRAIHLLETRGTVLDRVYEGDSVTLRAEVGVQLLDQIRSSGARIDAADDEGRPLPAAQAPGWADKPDQA